jgi:hypothetical protein
VLGSAVVGLLAANGVAVAVLDRDRGHDADRPAAVTAADPGAAGETAGPGRTVTVITTSDGRRLVADPGTEAGRRAIAEAERQGASTQDVTIPATSPSNGSTTGRPGGVDVGALLDALPHGGGATGAGAGPGVIEVGKGVLDDLLEKTGGTVTSVVEGAHGTVSSLLGTAPTTVTSVLGSTSSTVSSVVQGTQGTVSSLLGGAPSTVTSVVGGGASTVTSVVNQVTPTSTPLGPIVTSVSTLLPQATPTSAAPAAPPAPVCHLVIC